MNPQLIYRARRAVADALQVPSIDDVEFDAMNGGGLSVRITSDVVLDPSRIAELRSKVDRNTQLVMDDNKLTGIRVAAADMEAGIRELVEPGSSVLSTIQSYLSPSTPSRA